jgi:hypothetical protein
MKPIASPRRLDPLLRFMNSAFEPPERWKTPPAGDKVRAAYSEAVEVKTRLVLVLDTMAARLPVWGGRCHEATLWLLHKVTAVPFHPVFSVDGDTFEPLPALSRKPKHSLRVVFAPAVDPYPGYAGLAPAGSTPAELAQIAKAHPEVGAHEVLWNRDWLSSEEDDDSPDPVEAEARLRDRIANALGAFVVYLDTFKNCRKVRRCDWCSTWYYQGKASGLTCSDSCAAALSRKNRIIPDPDRLARMNRERVARWRKKHMQAKKRR